MHTSDTDNRESTVAALPRGYAAAASALMTATAPQPPLWTADAELAEFRQRA